MTDRVRKYEFTGETMQYCGLTLRRIRRLEDGLVGGWIEKEANLSHEGECFAYDNAKIFGEAWIGGNAVVSGNAWVGDEAQIFGNTQIGGEAKIYGNALVGSAACIVDNETPTDNDSRKQIAITKSTSLPRALTATVKANKDPNGTHIMTLEIFGRTVTLQDGDVVTLTLSEEVL